MISIGWPFRRAVWGGWSLICGSALSDFPSGVAYLPGDFGAEAPGHDCVMNAPRTPRVRPAQNGRSLKIGVDGFVLSSTIYPGTGLIKVRTLSRGGGLPDARAFCMVGPHVVGFRDSKRRQKYGSGPSGACIAGPSEPAVAILHRDARLYPGARWKDRHDHPSATAPPSRRRPLKRFGAV